MTPSLRHSTKSLNDDGRSDVSHSYLTPAYHYSTHTGFIQDHSLLYMCDGVPVLHCDGIYLADYRV